MRRLILANTYYQLIFAIQLKTTLFADDEVVLMVSDHSIGAQKVCLNLKQKGIFDDVHFIISKDIIYGYTSKDAWRNFIDFSFKKNNYYRFYLEGFDNLYFDEFIAFNYGEDIFGLYFILVRSNPQILMSRFEEGIFSYNTWYKESRKLQLACKIRKLFRGKTFYDAIGNFYCFFPSVYKGQFNPVKVPLISQESRCVSILNAIFEIDKEKIEYSEKYIFFTSVYDFEGGQPIGEFELVKQVADLVGKENLLVKMHPRDIRTIYHECGLKVDKNSSIPWEVIQMASDFSDKVFLTATSGSVLAGSLMSENPVQTYYLFTLCNLENNYASVVSVQNINNLLNNEEIKEMFKTVHIVQKIEDII